MCDLWSNNVGVFSVFLQCSPERLDRDTRAALQSHVRCRVSGDWTLPGLNTLGHGTGTFKTLCR